MFFKYFFNDSCLRKGHFLFLDIAENDVDFVDDFLASLDGVKKGFVEVVRGSIDELDKVILCNPVYHIICILLRDMHVIIFHLSASEYGHERA